MCQKLYSLTAIESRRKDNSFASTLAWIMRLTIIAICDIVPIVIQTSSVSFDGKWRHMPTRLFYTIVLHIG